MDCSLVRTLVQRYVSAAALGGTGSRAGTGPGDTDAAAAAPSTPRSRCCRQPRGPWRLGRLPGGEQDAGRTYARSLHRPGASDGATLPAPTCSSRCTGAPLPGARAGMGPSAQTFLLRLRSGPRAGGMCRSGLRLSLLSRRIRRSGGVTLAQEKAVIFAGLPTPLGGFRSEVWNLPCNQSAPRPRAF